MKPFALMHFRYYTIEHCGDIFMSWLASHSMNDGKLVDHLSDVAMELPQNLEVMHIVSACQEGLIAGNEPILASPNESCAPERNQVKCPNLIAGKCHLEPKDATIVSGIPAPRLWLKVAGPMDSEENLSLVAKVLEDTLKGASLKTSKGMLKGSV